MASRTSLKAQKPKVQEFRAQLRRLETAGLVGGKKGWTKSAVRSKKLLGLLKKYKPVATGEALAVKVKSSRILRMYKDKRTAPKGIKVADDIVMVPKDEGYTRLKIVRGDPLMGGLIAKVKPLKRGHIERVIFPMDFTTIEQWAKEAQARPEWNKLKTKNERFAFFINDNSSHQSYTSLADLQKSLLEYKSVKRMIEKKQYHHMKTFYRAFEVVRVSYSDRMRGRRSTPPDEQEDEEEGEE